MEDVKHSFKNTLKENLALAVYNTGYQKCAPGYTWGPALRDHYLLHYIEAGEGWYTGGGKTYHLTKGDLFAVFPSQVVCYVADHLDPWEYYWVGFNGTEARRMVQMTGFTHDRPVLRPSSPEDCKSLLLRIYESSGNTPAADACMAGYLYLFLGHLMKRAGDPAPVYGTQEYLHQALRFIQYNYASDIQVQDIARYAGVSRSQLYRAFLAHFDISPHAFLQRYRINEACGLLHRKAYTVTEIANSVGFSDPLYFSRAFKKIKGMSPSAYQKYAQGKEIGTID